MKNWEGDIYDGKIKIGYNPKINPKVNLKNTTEVKYIPQLKPLKFYRYIIANVIGDFQHTSN